MLGSMSADAKRRDELYFDISYVFELVDTGWGWRSFEFGVEVVVGIVWYRWLVYAADGDSPGS